ncbi:MAG: hypothetical protein M3P26_10535 [Gemmatimonadota bacterium]|nr:hypothetical protein [Gemmatimonadota bacterium]
MRKLATTMLVGTLACGGGDTTAPPPLPKEIRLAAAGPTTIAAGGTVQFSASVIDDRGYVMSGQPIAFTSSSPTVGTISSSGLFASLGPAGAATIAATSGMLSISLTVNVGPAAAASVAIAAGNNQKGFVRAALPVNPSLQVKDQYGNPVPGIAIAFTVTSGGGSVGPVSVASDGSGLAATSWTLGQSVGHNQLTATALGLAPLSFDADADSPYLIEVVYSPEVPLSERSAIDAGVQHWKRIITTDIGSVQFSAPGGCGSFAIAQGDIVRGLRIYVRDSAFAGATLLAQAGVCYENSVSKFPVVVLVVWNTNQAAYVQSNGLGEIVATHELAHTFGLGTVWRERSLLAGDGTADPYFTGPQALTTFGSSFGAGYVGNSVPVENTGSAATQGAHWRESVFNRELMTGFVNLGTPNPLSAVTIAQFADLGYVVDMSQAEVFTGAVLSSEGIAPRTSRIDLGDDVSAVPTRTVQPLRR